VNNVLQQLAGRTIGQVDYEPSFSMPAPGGKKTSLSTQIDEAADPPKSRHEGSRSLLLI
jgi:hypothetical protein